VGAWKLDARFNKAALVARVQKIARHGSRIKITDHDAIDVLRHYGRGGRRVLMLDPPYYKRGGELYKNAYTHEDHLRVAAVVSQVAGPWVMTYDSDPAILSMYQDSNPRRFIVSYSAQERYRGEEVMILSPGLAVPSMRSAATTPASDVTIARLARLGGQ
jgi:DNA adenine methylase